MSINSSVLKFKLTERIPLQDISGASGIAFNGSDIFIIGDNSPYLLQLRENGRIASKLPVHPLGNGSQNPIPKNIKPDFEALELISHKSGKEIIIFGSGSKSPERDVFKRVLLDEGSRVITYDLGSFYGGLRDLELLKNQELNIEAVAFHKENLYLFNRGKNLIFNFLYENFLKFLESTGPMPEIEITEIQLPEIEGIRSGFSGATTVGDRLLFTTSVENTPNAYDDGEVLGSFIGILEIDRLGNPDAPDHTLLQIGGKPWKTKVESISVSELISAREAEIIMVTDNDDGEYCELLRGRLSW